MKDFWGLNMNIQKWENEEIININQKEKEISVQIDRLKIEKNNLKQQANKLKQEHLKPVIGMCIKETKNCYVLIYKLPEEQLDSHINFYQLPVYKVDFNEEEMLIYTDTIFSRAVEASDPCACLAEEYEQISQKEFRDKVAQVCKQITKILIDND